MPILRGADRISDLFHGADRIARVYHGTDVVYDHAPWSDHADLDFWLSAEDFAGLTDGTAVTTWTDRAQAIALTATGSPAAHPGGTLGLNNRPTVEGSGSGQYFDGGSSVLDYHGVAGLTVIALVHPGYLSGNASIIARNASANRGWSLAVLTGEGQIQWAVATGTSAQAARVSTTDLNFKNFPAVIRTRYNGGTGELSIWVNGINVDGSLTGSVPATIGGTGGSSLRVLDNGFSNTMKGHLAECLVFGAALSDADAARFEAALIQRAKLYVFEETDVVTINAHQGVATDGSIYWAFDTTSLTKRDASWNTVATNSSPFTGLSGLNHVSDGFYLGGNLYTALTDFPSSGATRYIGVFNATTLVRTNAVSIGTRQPSGLCYDADRDVVWGVDHTTADPVVLHQWDRATLAYLSTLVTDFPFATQVQGVSYRDGLLYVTFGNDSTTDGLLVTVDPETGAHRPIYRRDTTEAEGLDFTGDDFLWVTVDGIGERVHLFTVTVP